MENMPYGFVKFSCSWHESAFALLERGHLIIVDSSQQGLLDSSSLLGVDSGLVLHVILLLTLVQASDFLQYGDM